jgi:uncharacterized protein
LSRVCIALLISLCCVSVFGLDLPGPPKQHVNDFAAILNAQQKQDLEVMVSDLEKQTSNQVLIAIFPALDDESLEDYTNRLFEKWGVGQKSQNNGVLITVFLKEKKVRIEVGYGLEPQLTDAISSRIIRNEIVPAFQQNRYYDGLRAAVIAIQKVIAGEYQPVAAPGQEKQRETPPVQLFIFVLVLLYIIYRSRNSSTTYRGRRRNGSGWWYFPGGFGGGGDWGGGSGGGGWGGGGGGSSGGGGASGGW